ncbi:hypothetical protein [Nocardioides sp. GY 10127]|uniref:hypothetical protein n=1 Tax=Nocardioides sp. GY 10127 TaxID=2569762 RepID=UPI0010A7C70E|nr:hypothetical protein [Nocardioides sp. GY 10127]TIC80950.1 hypothetical protein E8D37_14070 [Nocardioides sp. GY 10127]
MVPAPRPASPDLDPNLDPSLDPGLDPGLVLGLDLARDAVTAVLTAGGSAVARCTRPLAARQEDGATVLGLDVLLRETDAVLREVLASGAATAPGVPPLAGGALATGIAVDGDVLCVWDEETLGAPLPALLSVPDGSPWTVGAAWWAAHAPRTWSEVDGERYVVGDPATWLLARATRGVEHVTVPALRRDLPGAPVEALPLLDQRPRVRTDASALAGHPLLVTALLPRAGLADPALDAAAAALTAPGA